jgi:hypothetical protein
MNRGSHGESLRDQLRWEWTSFIETPRRHMRACVTGFVAVSVLFALFAGVATRSSLGDVPLVLLSGFIRSLQFLTIVALVWFFVIARFIHTAIHNWAEDLWVDRERKRRPGESFPVPYFRFSLFAFVPAALVFLALSTPLLYLLFILPGYNHVLDRALSIGLE